MVLTNKICPVEVRLEMGWLRKRPEVLSDREIELRSERPEDYHAVEQLEAFWNRHHPGCEEHYLVHLLRNHRDYLPQFSRAAVKDGEIIGAILHSKSYVQDKDRRCETVTFGPLCVKPEWQGWGIGKRLVEEMATLVREAGYPGIILFGEPDYYPRLGFQTCDRFGITTANGKNFPAFMALELRPESLRHVHGRFMESKVFEAAVPEKAEEYNHQFYPMKKQYFPQQ